MDENIIFIKGERVNLVVKTKNHIELYHKWINDPEVGKWLDVFLPEPLEVIDKEWFPEEKDEKGFWLEIWHKESHKPIGIVGLFRIHPQYHNAEFGIFIGENNYWGKGLGTEAAELMVTYGFKTLNLHKIMAGVNATNNWSIKMHEKVGFIEEGYLKEMEYIDGNWTDVIMFGLLRENKLK
jgi:RimJ/RimL family protein N-acetyltransferase